MGVVAGEYGDRAATVNVMSRLVAMSTTGLNDLTAGADDVAGMVQAAVEGFEAEADETIPDLAILAGYLQAIVERPSLVTVEKLDDRFDAYSNLVTEFATLLVEIPTDSAGFNRALAVELAMSSALNGLAVVVTTGKPDTRSHAVSLADQLLTIFEGVVEELDLAQEAFEDLALNSRYYSQTATYSIAFNMITTCVRYPLQSAYDLRIEKRFTLREPTAPIMLAIREYPGTAISDAYDLLIQANSLTGIEILLLDAGREVIVYA
jgi:hypothetical protein